MALPLTSILSGTIALVQTSVVQEMTAGVEPPVPTAPPVPIAPPVPPGRSPLVPPQLMAVFGRAKQPIAIAEPGCIAAAVRMVGVLSPKSLPKRVLP